MELSATQSKVPHIAPGGGHLLNPWGPPLESIPSEQSATRSKVPHHMRGGGHLLNLWGPPLESVGQFPVMTSYSRNLIILISHKKDNLHGEWEEVMDAGMMPCL